MNVDSATRKAKRFISKGMLSEAQEVYELILESYPNNRQALKGVAEIKASLNKLSPTTRSELTQGEVDNLLALIHSAQLDLALDEANQLLLRFPNNELLYNLLGVIHSQTGQIDQAILAYQKSVELQPRYFHAYSNLGNLFVSLGKLKEAEKSYRTALDIKPDYAQAYCNLSNVLNLLKDHNGARLSAQKAIEIEPNLAEAYNNIGIAFSELLDKDSAVDAFSKALQINPSLAQVHCNLAGVYASRQQYDLALRHYTNAIEIDPNFGDAHGAMGATLRAIGKIAEGLTAERKGWGVIKFDVDEGIEVTIA